MDYKNVSIEKYLHILFVVGSAFHSTTFEFTKQIFIDIFYNSEFTQKFYGIAIRTILADINTSFGDVNLYEGVYYSKEVEYLFAILEKNRKIIEEELKFTIFKNNNYSITDSCLLNYQANTYTTYV